MEGVVFKDRLLLFTDSLGIALVLLWRILQTKSKPYWKDAPERRDEMIDENGCRTVIKKIVDPEDEKKSNSDKAKSVVITKECEYPNLNGPDAKITEARPLKPLSTSRFDNDDQPATYDIEPESYEDTRPEELNSKNNQGRDPLASDYIDSMLEKHFKSFPGFTNPLSSFKGYQERFKLRTPPEAFKNVKPTVDVKTYAYSSPKSGFAEDEERQSSAAKESTATRDDAPRTYDHHYHYDYPEHSPRKPDYPERSPRKPDYPERSQRKPDYPDRNLRKSEYDDEDEAKSEAKPAGSKDPKMHKKSFAYYRKDNPKDDPNDHQYAEEYAQGNFRSFSSSYDSEKDGPKKKKE